MFNATSSNANKSEVKQHLKTIEESMILNENNNPVAGGTN